MDESTNTQLSAEQRLFGLASFWRCVSQNFAYFDLVPDLDFDAAFQSFIPKVIEAKDTYQYYQLLRQFCALLKDGHTNIWLPPGLEEQSIDRPRVELVELAGRVVVGAVGSSLSKQLPLGSVINKVDGVDVNACIEKQSLPYVSSSTDYVRHAQAAKKVLYGEPLSQVHIEYTTPTGEKRATRLVRDSQRSSEHYECLGIPKSFTKALYSKPIDEDFYYVSLNSFESPSIIENFERLLPRLRQTKGLVLDLRYNSGGSTSIGSAILAHLIERPVQGATGYTRQHVARNQALVQLAKEVDPNMLDEEGRAYLEQELSSQRSADWIVDEGEWVTPAADPILGIPIYVLIGHGTASAAEDFLVYIRDIENFTTVGERSFGSTGQPIFGELPAGGGFRVCTVKSTYPDGALFNGFGIEPDLPHRPSLEDYLNKKDSTLEYAIERMTQSLEACV